MSERLTINGMDKLIGYTFRGGNSVLVVVEVGHGSSGSAVYAIKLNTIPFVSYGPFYIHIHRKLHPIEPENPKWGKMEVKIEILGNVYYVPVDVWFKDMETFCEKVNTEIWTKY